MPQDSPFNNQEQELFNKILDVNEDFPKVESWEAKEWNDAIHKLQDIIIRQAFRRLFPNILK